MCALLVKYSQAHKYLTHEYELIFMGHRNEVSTSLASLNLNVENIYEYYVEYCQFHKTLVWVGYYAYSDLCESNQMLHLRIMNFTKFVASQRHIFITQWTCYNATMGYTFLLHFYLIVFHIFVHLWRCIIRHVITSTLVFGSLVLIYIYIYIERERGILLTTTYGLLRY